MSNTNSNKLSSVLAIELSASDAQQWKLAAEIHEKHQDFDKALHCWCNALKLSCTNDEKENIGLYGNRLIENGCQIIQPSESFFKQDLLTLLYALGCGFYRNQKTVSAISILEVAVELYNYHLQTQSQDQLNTDEILLMKVYFELACCKETTMQLDHCIADFRTSLLLAVHNNDISFEKMVLLRFCNVLVQKQLFLEAASGYIRLLSIKSDIKNTLKDDMSKFKAHWTVECDCEIRYGLCVAYKALFLFDRAVVEGLKYKQLLTSLPNVKLSKPRLRSAVAVTHTMEINFILGEIYEALNDLPSSLSAYQEWLGELKRVAILKSGDDLGSELELARAHESVGTVCFKLRNHKKAQECFAMLTKIGRLSINPELQVHGMLLEGDVLLAMEDCDGARSIFGQALKFSQGIPEDSYELECKCMIKEAEVFAKEHRYTHALYRCEQALSLGRKSTNTFSLVDIERQVALYSQHSTSEKELLVAFKFLMDEIVVLESKLQALKMEGVVKMYNEETILHRDYVAIQVILHKLGEHKLSLAFGECLKGRSILKSRNELPTIPQVEIKDISCAKANEHICIVDVDEILASTAQERTILAFTLTDEGLLIHVHNAQRNLTYSYLSSDHVVEPHLIKVKLQEMIELLCSGGKPYPAEKLQLMYNTENRCLPDISSSEKHCVKLDFKLPAKQMDGSGDGASDGDKLTISNKGDVGEGDASLVNKGEKESARQKEIVPLRELYKLLVQPVENALQTLPENAPVSISVDELLLKIPFDHLVNPVDKKPMGERFNVISTPSVRHFGGNKRFTPGITVKHQTVSRRNEIKQNFDDPTDLLVLEEVGMEKNLSGLVSTSASGTNILSSSSYMAPYRQAEFFDKSCVIGNPDISKSLQLNGHVWKPKTKLAVAQKECKQVADYLGVSPVIGKLALKSEFLRQICESSVLHIATYGSFEKGILAFCPDNFPFEKEPISMERYMVTLQDLLDISQLTAKLVVLSSGQKWTSKSQPSNLSDVDLPNVFLAAGVQAVVFSLWSVPDNVSETFYYHFYRCLQTGSRVSTAVYKAKAATKLKHSNPLFWNAFIALGSDVSICLSEIRGCEIHQSISGVESNKLSASILVESERSSSTSYLAVQKAISRLTGNLDWSCDSDVIPFMLGLLEEATDRLTKDENVDRPIIILPEAVEAIDGTTALLEMVGFGFQNVSLSSLPLGTRASFATQSNGDAKMIVFPHWNHDDLLLPVHQALSGLIELSGSEESLRAVSLLLPISDEILLCKLIDFLAVLHHTPHVQLHITDDSANALWNVTRIRKFLHSIGVYSVRTLIVFFKTVEKKSLLMSALQLLLAVCQHRNGQLLEELNVGTLGMMPSEAELPKKILKSFNAVVMPRNEILVTSSWTGGDGHMDEGGDRKSLAMDISHVKNKYNRVLEHAKWWHQDLKIPKQLSQGGLQSAENEKFNSPRKVKVQSGATPSCNRFPLTVDENSRRPELFEVLRRREEARNVLQKRCVDIKQRQASALRSSYLPFVKSGHK